MKTFAHTLKTKLLQHFILLTLTAASGLTQTAPAPFVPDDIQVGATGTSYSDPEFHSGTSRVVFQNSSAGVPRVWIGEINPATGSFVSANGQDLLVDTGIATLGPTAQTNNGPEWGEDSTGVSVWYSKPDGSRLPQLFRASNLTAGAVIVTQMTNVTGPSWATNATVRQDASLPTTKFFYRHAAGPEGAGPSRWADETAPTLANTLPGFNTAAFAPSWVAGTEELVYSRFTSPTTTELYLYSTTTLSGSVITSEPAVVKQNIIAFRAPEFGGELCYACVADGAGLAIYRNLGSGYTRVTTLTANNPALPYMYSPEMFQTGGVTYFAVVMQDNANYLTATEGAIYVLSLGADPAGRIARRVDNGTAANRFEPELLIGTNEVFVYFNIGGQLRRARTGIPVESRLSNVSVRSTLAAGQSLILGAVVSGGTKEVLVRSAGPALNQFGLAGLADPRLELYTGGSTPAAANDDWPAALGATFGAVGAFPFPAGSRDAALVQTLNGPFTVVTRGTGAGAVLVEAYNVGGDTAARLVNVSVRHQVGRGADILIAGFAVAGTGTKQLLIRATGPALTQFGVTGVLADPNLEVFGAAGARLGGNDNWPTALGPTFARVGAFGLPIGSRDAALLINLPAGTTYTVQVSGADGGTGEALVEIYEVP